MSRKTTDNRFDPIAEEENDDSSGSDRSQEEPPNSQPSLVPDKEVMEYIDFISFLSPTSSCPDKMLVLMDSIKLLEDGPFKALLWEKTVREFHSKLEEYRIAAHIKYTKQSVEEHINNHLVVYNKANELLRSGQLQPDQKSFLSQAISGYQAVDALSDEHVRQKVVLLYDLNQCVISLENQVATAHAERERTRTQDTVTSSLSSTNIAAPASVQISTPITIQSIVPSVPIVTAASSLPISGSAPSSSSSSSVEEEDPPPELKQSKSAKQKAKKRAKEQRRMASASILPPVVTDAADNQASKAQKPVSPSVKPSSVLPTSKTAWQSSHNIRLNPLDKSNFPTISDSLKRESRSRFMQSRKGGVLDSIPEESSQIDDVLIMSLTGSSGAPDHDFNLEDVYDSDNVSSERATNSNVPTPNSNHSQQMRIDEGQDSQSTSRPTSQSRGASPIANMFSSAASSFGTPIKQAFESVGNSISQSMQKAINSADNANLIPMTNQRIQFSQVNPLHHSRRRSTIPNTSFNLGSLVDVARGEQLRQSDEVFNLLSNEAQKQRQIAWDRQVAQETWRKEVRESDIVAQRNADARRANQGEEVLGKGVLESRGIDHRNTQSPPRSTPVETANAGADAKDREVQVAQAQAQEQSDSTTSSNATPVKQHMRHEDNLEGGVDSDDSIDMWAGLRGDTPKVIQETNAATGIQRSAVGGPRISKDGILQPPAKKGSGNASGAARRKIRSLRGKSNSRKPQDDGGGDDDGDTSDDHDSRDKKGDAMDQSNPLYRRRKGDGNGPPSDPDRDNGKGGSGKQEPPDEPKLINPLNRQRSKGIETDLTCWVPDSLADASMTSQRLQKKIASGDVRASQDIRRSTMDTAYYDMSFGRGQQSELITSQLAFTPQKPKFDFKDEKQLTIPLFEDLAIASYTWTTGGFTHQPPNIMNMLNAQVQDEIVKRNLEVQTMIYSGQNVHVRDKLVFSKHLDTKESMQSSNYCYMMCKIQILVTFCTTATEFDRRMKEIVQWQFRKLNALAANAWESFAMFTAEMSTVMIDLKQRLNLLNFSSGLPIFTSHDKEKKKRYNFSLMQLLSAEMEKKGAKVLYDYIIEQLQYPPRPDGLVRSQATERKRKFLDWRILLDNFLAQMREMVKKTSAEKHLKQIFKEQTAASYGSRHSSDHDKSKITGSDRSIVSTTQPQKRTSQDSSRESKRADASGKSSDKPDPKKRFFMTRRRSDGTHSLKQMTEIDGDDDLEVYDLDNDLAATDVLLQVVQQTDANINALRQGTMDQFKPLTASSGTKPVAPANIKSACLLKLFHGECTRPNCPFNHDDNRAIRQELVDRWGRELVEHGKSHKLQLLEVHAEEDDGFSFFETTPESDDFSVFLSEA